MLKRAKCAVPAVIVALLVVVWTTAVAHARPAAPTGCDAAKLDSARPSLLPLDLATAHAAPTAIAAPSDRRLDFWTTWWPRSPAGGSRGR